MAKQRISVVIADDNDMMRGVLRAMLRGEEYDVIGEASNGVLAVDIADPCLCRLETGEVGQNFRLPVDHGIELIRADGPLGREKRLFDRSDFRTGVNHLLKA